MQILGRRRLDLLRRLHGSIIVPPAVHSELDIDSGRPGTNVLQSAFTEAWLRVEVPTPKSKVAELALILDLGEAEASCWPSRLRRSFS